MHPGTRTGSNFGTQVYESCLESFLKSSTDLDIKVLMEDGSLVHTIKVSKLWQEYHLISKIKSPTNIPDLNPIEKICCEMKRRVSTKNDVKSVEEMFSAMQTKWEAIDKDILGMLIGSQTLL